MNSKREYGLNPIMLGLHNETLYEPQRTNHFEVFIDLPTALNKMENTNRSKAIKYLTLATTDFSLPNISISPVEIPYGNTKVKIAGSVEYGGADSLTCTDYIGADIEAILYSWQNLVFNPETSQIGWAKSYKSNAKVIEYAPDGNCLSSWILRGVWPATVDYGNSLSKGDSQVKSVSVTLSYDLAYRKFGSTNRSAKAAENAAMSTQSNMLWKNQTSYKSSNSGGPLGPLKDNF